VGAQLENAGIPVEYEQKVIHYTTPETPHKYRPDFELPNGIIIETKGRFVLDDRKKHIQVKEQNPELDIRFVFSNSKSKIAKTSSTTYASWCLKNGFKFADKLIPSEWLNEPPLIRKPI
jgi:Phage endonuclease I.